MSSRPEWWLWYDHPLVKPLVLSRWSFMGGKHWHPRAKRLARLRRLYWTLVRRYETEMCARCGGPVRLVFHAPDSIWEAAAAFPGNNARHAGGEAAGGVLCPPCFDDLADEAGLPYLRWTCDTADWPMTYRGAA